MKEINKNKKIKRQEGITLIALIITVVIMLILAGVAIAGIVDSEGLFNRTREASEKYENASKDEGDMIKNMGDILDEYISNIEDENINVNWGEVLNDANSNPEKYKHQEQSDTNNDIGIGTDGKPVNLDLWNYIKKYTGEIVLSNSSTSSPAQSNGYKDQNATKINGTVPQYIKIAGDNEFLPVIELYNTFAGCVNLLEIPTLPSTVTSMFATFYNCRSLTSIPENLFANTPEVTNLSYTFYGCTGLTSIPENLFANTPKVTNLSYTFRGCTGLTSIPENLFANTPEVTDLSYTFYGCTGLTSISENLFANTQNVIRFSSTFNGCTGLTGNAPEIWKRSNVNSFKWCFYNCTGLDNYDDIPADWK